MTNPGIFSFPQNKRNIDILGFPLRLARPEQGWSRSLDVPGYTARWDASQYSSFTVVSGAVSQWNDLSGNGYNFTQGTAGLRPNLTDYTLNGYLVPHFDGTDDAMVSSFPLNIKEATRIWVGVPETAGIVLWGTQGNGGMFTYWDGGSTYVQFIDRYAGGSRSNVAVKHPATQLEPVVVVQVVSAVGLYTRAIVACHSFEFDGSSGYDGAGPGFNNSLSIGTSYSWPTYKGTVAEMIHYASVLSDVDLTSVLGYLRLKWGIWR